MKKTLTLALVAVALMMTACKPKADNGAATLTKYFTTTACTVLNGTYSGMTDANLRSAMGSLPAVVQDMALKVKNNAWATYSGWDKTERTYRVADYSPYSNSATWTNAIGLSYRLGRLSNPTGIYATTGDVLQVYVGNVPSGQSVAGKDTRS